MIEIATSILSVKENIAQTFYNLEVAKTDYFHIDVMDGKFVPESTEAMMKEYSGIIKHISNIPLDVHLMVRDVKAYIEEYLPFLPLYITVHYESFEDKEKIEDTIQYLKDNNIKVGLSIKPETSEEKIYEYLHKINMILVMTVKPGYGGQKLIPETLEKIKNIKKYIQYNNLDCYIQADGGINLETIEEIRKAGTDIAVVGSAIINSKDYKQTIRELKNEG